MATLRLTWNSVDGAVSYNIYNKQTAGLSVAFTPLLVNTTDTFYDHTGLTEGSTQYYIVAAVGPNNEIGPPSPEISLIAGAVLAELYLCAADFNITQPLTAEAYFTDNTSNDVTSTATWQSSSTGVATVSSSGVVSLVGTGSTNITATYQALSQYLTLDVILPSSVWQEELTSSLHFSYIQGFDDTHIWAASGFDSGHNTVYFSTGDGSWSAQTLPSLLSCNQIYAASATVVYISNYIGPSNALFKTIDGGSNWTELSVSFSTHTANYLTGIHGISTTALWALAYAEDANTYIIKSIDGGSTWSQEYMMSAYGNHIWANSASDVWTADYAGNYYHWNGTIWSTGIIDATQGFDGIWGTSTSNMFFGGFSLGAGNSKIYHWNGSTFNVVQDGPSNSNDWWVFSADATGTDIWSTDFNYSTSAALIWRSQDGGSTWSTSDTPAIHTTEQLVGVWVGTNKVYTCSQSGTILALDLNPALTISPKLVKNFVISPSSTSTVSTGHPRAFTATANYSDGTSADVTTSVTWNSSNTNAATIDAYGVATAVTIGQNTNITITASNFHCHYPAAVVLSCITPPALVSISIVFSSQPTSTTRQYAATGHYSDSSTLDITNTATWTSTNGAVGTIDSSGLFTYVAAGSTDIYATLSAINSNTITVSLTDMWGSEANPPATMLGGFALTSTNLFINNSYVSPSKILKSSGNGIWTDTSMGLGSNPTNTVGVWGTGSLVLVGGQGTTSNAIIRSIDAGSTWATVSNSFTGQVWWIHGSSSSNIWAAGGTNVLLQSIDSGATWSSISFPGGFIEGIHAISSSDVWVGGANAAFTSGVLYHYNGTTFTSFYSNLGATVIINSVWASSSSDIYVMASSTDYFIKYIYHSTNSGTTFTLEYKIFDDTAHDRPKVFGINSSSIYAGTSPTQILHSTGSGTWTRETVALPDGTNSSAGSITTILATDDNHVWAAGTRSPTTLIIKRNAILDITPVLVSIAVTGSTSISGTAQYRATGTYDDSRTIDITADVVWSSTNTGTATISNSMSTIGLATNVGAGSTDITATLGSISGFLTISGSAAWSVFYDKANQPTSPATGYSTVPATGGNIAMYTGLAKVGNTIVASNGVQSWFAGAASGSGKYPFLTTTNNGSTFQVASWPLATDSNQALDGNSFYAPNIYATTDKFLVGCERSKTSNLTTSTDGLTWDTSVQISPNTRAVAAFHSTSNSNIWAVSDTPTGSIYVWQSTDDGASWNAISSPISSGGSTYFPSVFTISSTDVWVAGATNGTNANPCVYHWNGSTWTDCSAALRTARGGNFNALIIGIYASSTNDVYFIDANWGHNQLYHTSNQGTSFTVIDVDASNSVIFNAIAGTSASNIYLAGYSGNIYHYNGSTWAKETLPGSPSYIATSDYLGLWIDGSTVYACGNNIIKK